VYLSSPLADLEAERDLAIKTIAEFGVIKTSYRASEEGVVAMSSLYRNFGTTIWLYAPRQIVTLIENRLRSLSKCYCYRATVRRLSG
jgi:hypothetical protein